MADGYKADEMIAGVLGGLGFQQSDWTRLCSEFSGGWQMRIALARLLLGQMGQGDKSFLLLDEPTNHLDNKAKLWLGDYLKRAEGAVIIVSHDEALLNRACDRIGEIRGGELHTYVGNYAKFLREREARALALAQEVAAKQLEIDKLQGFVDRFGAKATKASAANSKKKAIAKLQAAMPVSAAPAAGGSGANASAGDRRKTVVKLPPPPACAREVLILRKGAVGWEGGPTLIRDVELKLEVGMRMVILGPNGCGKSTLLRALAGPSEGESGHRHGNSLQGGERLVGMGVQMGVFTQDLAQDLPQDISGLDCVLEIAREKDPTVTNEQGRSALGALGLVGDATLRPIRELSGGEKARVALGGFVLRAHNVLLLDEASNHLDRPTVKALADALSKFKGAIVAITHDQEFCEALVPTHVARVHPDGTLTVRLCINGELKPSDFEHNAIGDAASSSSSLPQASGQSQKGRGGRGGGGGVEIVTKEKKPGGRGGMEGSSSPVNGLSNGKAVAAREVTKGGRAPNDREERKRLSQMQSRIKKLLQNIEIGETACRGYDEELAAAGSDAGKALKVLKTKEEVQAKVAEFEKEWIELESQVEELSTKLGSPLL
eukprot:TRINITY_DN20585_c0_g1_i1.p1 TRINITY_DN20585_c0_g1~~TRINITY_DN20585_c0_g1_i1.p1  ORF type:complete len:605 (-),score=139.72 TRINITY_DN20585_c0_g1_i1:158-1972(-)